MRSHVREWFLRVVYTFLKFESSIFSFFFFGRKFYWAAFFFFGRLKRSKQFRAKYIYSMPRILKNNWTLVVNLKGLTFN